MNDTLMKLLPLLKQKEEEIKNKEAEIKEAKKNKSSTLDSIEKENKRLTNEFNVIWMKVLDRIPLFIKGENQNEMIEGCKIFGKRLKDGDLSTSQIRNIFGEVKRIQMKASTSDSIDILSLNMLQPKLAYSAARAKKHGTDELKDLLTKGLETILENDLQTEEVKFRFENFANFFEALLAYHKAVGGN